MLTETRSRKRQRLSPVRCIAPALLTLIPAGVLISVLATPYLIFTSICLTALALAMLVTLTDRNREIERLSRMLHQVESDHKQLKEENADRYWDDVDTVTRRRTSSAIERKRHAAMQLLSTGNMRDYERGHIMLAQCDAAAKSELVAVSELRIGDAERSEIIGKLGDHYAAGRLDREELDDRMNKAGKAKTAAQLAELLRDLP